ncbi:MAG: N-acetyltransferase family protein, partial [Alphaproteobacteria bacterium]
SKFTAAAARRDELGPRRIVDAVVAERDGRLVGFAFWHDGYELAHAARGVYMTDLYVAPAARRDGVGEALMAAVARAAKRRGRSFLWWVSKPWNKRAHAFYRAVGAQYHEPLVGHAIVYGAFEALAAAVRQFPRRAAGAPPPRRRPAPSASRPGTGRPRSPRRG